MAEKNPEPKKHGGGPRPHLTPAINERLVQAIRAGNYRDVAAQYAGIGPSTLYLWMRKGRKEKCGPYRDLVDAIDQADAHAEVRAVAIVQKLMNDNWQAAMTFLERRHPDRWRRREGHDVQFAKMSDDDLIARATGMLPAGGATGADTPAPEPEPEPLP